MTTWGPSNNGMWKLGYDFVVTGETSTHIDVTLILKIWTRYSTFDYYNTLNVSGSWGGFSGAVGFTTSTNNSWSTNNIREIKRFSGRFDKAWNSYNGYNLEFSAELTGIEYSNFSYRESVSGRMWVNPPPYGKPAAPSGVTVARLSDTQIRIRWTNNNNSPSSPYKGIKVFMNDLVSSGESEIASLGETATEFIWNGSSANRRFSLYVKAINKDAQSDAAYSQGVYTTPAPVSNITSGTPTVTGPDESRTISLPLSWGHPTSSLTVTNYLISWTGPTSGSTTSTGKNVTVTGLRPGRTYTFSVTARNTGDGSATLSSNPVSYSITLPAPPSNKTNVSAALQAINGASEPRSSTYMISWLPVTGATKYVVKNGSTTLYSGPNTSYALSGVAAGSNTTIDVYPANDYGLGVKSTVVFTAPGLPGVPKINMFVPTSSGLRVELGPGTSNGSPILYYEYRITNSGGEVIPWTRAPSMAFEVAAASGVYALHARSVSEVGAGASISLASNATAGRVWVWNGSQLVRTSVRTYNGSAWVLTNV